MAKPQIKKITPFDADKEYEITLTWIGSRAHANRIIIYDNDTNNVVFDDTVSSFALRHTIPAHTLTNGRKYIIQAQTYDTENIPSALSDKVLFHTFATPEFYFEDLSENAVITNSSFTAEVHYHSDDWEAVSKYVFYLYDASKKLLIKSSELTDDNISYTYKGLDNNTIYYIRCAGVTVNGMELDTGYQEITVRYENPNTYARIYASPLPSQGCIQVSTNLIIIQYDGTETFEYIDNKMIDLRGRTLYYREGFSIKDDFTVIIRGTHLWQNGDIFKMCNENYGLTLSSRIYSNGKLRFRLLVPNGAGSYLLYSEEQVFEDNDLITIAVRRKNNVYQLKVFSEPENLPAPETFSKPKNLSGNNNLQIGGD